ncbi:DUF1684 domain-containing protein [Gryllotalpicola reticulitermitis]|uniref:DUF1684 domain-containing protein n=1 Tax=Gryllotalpicola reticulitermitis TaxID=1184153 RepID=A0ABV8Q4C5_9MICO
MTDVAPTAVETADWRLRTFALYDEVRTMTARSGAAAAHALWVAGRDGMLATHPASAITPDERETFRGVPVARYDPAWRFEATIEPAVAPRRWDVETGTDGVVPFELVGTASVPDLGSLDVWRLTTYGGGLFVPVKDALAGRSAGTYGGGRYLIDTIKGAWLGGGAADGSATIVLDFNFAYNPSCAYDEAWACPLAQAGNTLPLEVPVGERMP